jgi:hypothetical protein
VLPSRLILFDLTFSVVPGPLFLLASVAFKDLLQIKKHHATHFTHLFCVIF